MARAIAVLFAAATLVAAAPVTLRQAVLAGNAPIEGLDPAELDRPITSYAVRDDPGLFVIAYYSDNGGPIRVRLFDKASRRWRSRDLRHDTGSITGIHISQNYILLDTHVNPSAGHLLVLTKSLELREALSGWFLAIFEDETVVFHNSLVHFAPTHSAEVSVYDPRTRRQRKIYPLRPYQAVRRAHIERLRAAWKQRGEEWFARNNHHMDPERFTNYLRGAVALDNPTRSLAFVAAYDGADLGSGDIEVAYVYRNIAAGRDPEYREFVAGAGSPAEWLKPGAVERIFRAPP